MAANPAERQKLCVCGFIREYFSETGSQLPDDLTNMCLSFYMILVDVWKKPNKYYEINEDTKTLTRNEKVITRFDAVAAYDAFGTIVVKKGNIQRWKLRIINDSPLRRIRKWTCNFGVYDINKEKYDHRGGFITRYEGWGMYAYNGYKMHGIGGGARTRVEFAKKLDRNDVVTMTLDMSANKSEFGLLSYQIDDKDYGIAFDNLPIDKEYSMALSMYYNEKVQLLDE